MKKLLLKSMLLLCALIVGSGSAWGQSNKSAVHSSNVTLSGGTNCTVVISSSNYSGKKLGSNGSGGSCTFSAPAGTKYIHIHVAAWNNKNPTLTVKNGSTPIQSNISLTSDANVSGSSTTYTLATQANATTNYYKVVTLTTALTESATITIQSVGERVAVWGVNTEEESTDEATSVTIDDSGITNTDIASGTAAGSLSAVVKNSSSVAIDGASVTWSSSNTTVATIGATTGIITLIKKGSTTITASYAGVSGTYQSSNKTYVLNVTNSAANDGTSAHPFTVSEARDALDASETDAETNYYVKGIIAKIGTLNADGQLTYWVSDNGSMTNSLQCYKGKNVDGAAFAAATDLEVGDIATVMGKLKIYGSTYELDENNEVVSIATRTKVNIATFTATTNPLILGETESTATAVTNDQPGWTPASYTYESDDEAVATVNASGVVTAVAKGTANITVTPVVSATDPTYKVGDSKSIAIIVSNPSHTASFSINGVIDPANNVVVEEDEAISFPTDPAAILGKSFVGWTTDAIDGKQNDAPAVLVKAATMSTSNVTYYAVFAKGSETTGWRKLAASEVTEAGTYALLTTDGHAFNGTITSGHGQVTTNAFSFINNVATSAPTGTYELTLTEVTGGFTIYHEGDGYLYAAAASSGNLDWQNSPSSYWYYESDNWKFKSNGANLRSYNNGSIRTYANNSGAVLVFAHKTNITSYSAYCTTVVPDEPSTPDVDNVNHTVTLTTTANMAGWRTFAPIKADQNYTADADVYYVSTAGSSSVTLVKIDGGVPANTPVILHQTSGTTITLTETATDISAPGASNLLAVSTAGDNLGTVYRLGYKSAHGVGFYTYTTTSAPAGIVYINPSSPGHEFLGLDFDGETTGVNEVTNTNLTNNTNEFYNLAGQRVAQPTKGLYIVNGKKVILH